MMQAIRVYDGSNVSIKLSARCNSHRGV